MGRSAQLKASKRAGGRHASSAALAEGSGRLDKPEQPQRVRVWWVPTTDRKRSEFAGAYWPAQLVKAGDTGTGVSHVLYDNGDEEDVSDTHIFMEEPPVAFGSEDLPIQTGEFVEVHTGSKTDPSAWVAKLVRTDKSGIHWYYDCLVSVEAQFEMVVDFPFHDPQEPEEARPENVRRARVMESGRWRLLKPNQTWAAGQVTSPLELTTIDEEKLGEYVDLTGSNLAPGTPSQQTTPAAVAPPAAAAAATAAAPLTAAPATAAAATSTAAAPPASRKRSPQAPALKAETARKHKGRPEGDGSPLQQVRTSSRQAVAAAAAAAAAAAKASSDSQ